MADIELPPTVSALIDRYLGSIDEVEVLLLLYARRGERLRAGEIATAAHKPESEVAEHLRNLTAFGLVTHDEKKRTYAYDPGDEELDTAIGELSRTYDEKPVTLVKALNRRTPRSVRSFSDAFLLRGE